MELVKWHQHPEKERRLGPETVRILIPQFGERAVCKRLPRNMGIMVLPRVYHEEIPEKRNIQDGADDSYRYQHEFVEIIEPSCPELIQCIDITTDLLFNKANQVVLPVS